MSDLWGRRPWTQQRASGTAQGATAAQPEPSLRRRLAPARPVPLAQVPEQSLSTRGVQMKLNQNTCRNTAPEVLQPLQDTQLPRPGWTWAAVRPLRPRQWCSAASVSAPTTARKVPSPWSTVETKLSTARWYQPTQAPPRPGTKVIIAPCSHVSCPRQGQRLEKGWQSRGQHTHGYDGDDDEE